MAFQVILEGPLHMVDGENLIKKTVELVNRFSENMAFRGPQHLFLNRQSRKMTNSRHNVDMFISSEIPGDGQRTGSRDPSSL